MSEEDEEYIVIQRDYAVSPAKITIHRFVSPRDEACEVIEETIKGNMTEEWLMNEREFVALKKKLNRFKL